MPEEEHEVETPCDQQNPSSHHVWSSCGMKSDDCGESEHGDNDWSMKKRTATDSNFLVVLPRQFHHRCDCHHYCHLNFSLSQNHQVKRRV